MNFKLVPTDINPLVQDYMIEKAKEFSGVEIGGVLLQNDQVVIIKNVHAEPEHNFQMDHDDWATLGKIHGVGGIKGIFHSHPSQGSFPSVTDQEALKVGGYLMPGWKYWILTHAGVFQWEFYELPAISA